MLVGRMVGGGWNGTLRGSYFFLLFVCWFMMTWECGNYRRLSHLSLYVFFPLFSCFALRIRWYFFFLSFFPLLEFSSLLLLLLFFFLLPKASQPASQPASPSQWSSYYHKGGLMRGEREGKGFYCTTWGLYPAIFAMSFSFPLSTMIRYFALYSSSPLALLPYFYVCFLKLGNRSKKNIKYKI